MKMIFNFSFAKKDTRYSVLWMTYSFFSWQNIGVLKWFLGISTLRNISRYCFKIKGPWIFCISYKNVSTFFQVCNNLVEMKKCMAKTSFSDFFFVQLVISLHSNLICNSPNNFWWDIFCIIHIWWINIFLFVYNVKNSSIKLRFFE